MKKIFTHLLIAVAFVLVSLSAKAQYCKPLHSVNCSVNKGINAHRDSDIRNFVFNTIQNKDTSCDTSGYRDFSSGTGNLTTTVYPGQTVPFYIQGGYVNPTVFGIWVDWDNDQTFAASEMIWSGPSIAPTGNHAQYGYITIPSGATAGTKRMRVRSQFNNAPMAGTLACTDIVGETEDYSITVAAATNMTLDNVEITPITRDLLPGMNRSKILLVNIKTNGNTSPLSLTQLDFSLTGSTSAANIDNAKLFWGNSLTAYDSILRPAAQLGSTITNISSGISFTGLSQTLNPGNNYVWLTFDLDTGAVVNSLFSAELTDCKLNGSSVSVGSTPNGSRSIVSYVNYNYFIPNPTVKVRNNAIPGPNTYNIGNIIFNFDNQITNNTADLDTMTFYSSLSADVQRLGTYNYSGNAGIQNNLQAYVIWVDWDNDGMYDPLSEEEGFGNGLTTYNGSFDIPCNATTGPHRIRVCTEWMANYWNMNYNSFSAAVRPTPTEPLLGGDIEEYTINVLPDVNTMAHFTHDSVGYINGFTRFFNNSTGVGNTFEWDFNNDGTTDATSENPTYRYQSSGWKVVKLTVSNTGCNGNNTDTYIDSVFIIAPIGLPTADWVVNRNITDINLAVLFTDKSFEGPNSWTWEITPAVVNGFSSHFYINGTNANSQHPEVIFLAPGLYTVKLTVANNNGTGVPEERINYIKVLDPFSMCGTGTNSTDLHGFLYDDGGGATNYVDAGVNGQLCTFLIEPSSCVDEIYIDWNDFDVNLYGASNCPTLGGDLVRVFDGEDNTGIALHALAGFPNGFTNAANNIPALPPNLVAKSGKVYIEFFKNCAFNGRGFALEWYSTPTVGAQLPQALAIIPDTVYMGDILDFKAVSTEPGLKFSWDLDNDGTIDQTDSVFTAFFNTAGNRTLVLLAENCAGIDSFIKVITVINPGPPSAQFEAAHRQLLVGEKVQFTDLSEKAIFNWSWNTNRAGDIEYVDNTTFSSSDPVIRFLAMGKYTVSLQVDNVVGSDNETKTDYIEVIGGTPCFPAQIYNTDIGISRVKFEGINHSSAVGQSSYSNFVGFGEAVLEQGSSYSINIERITTFDRMTRAVWIDWNGDGDFADTLELAAYEMPSRAKNYITNIQVPPSPFTHFGPVRMRIGASLGYDTLLACGSLTNTQEYEDYRVVVRPSLPVITLTANDTLMWDAGIAYVDPGFSALDYNGVDITANIMVSGTVNHLAIGDYLLYYNVKDALGNDALTVTRLVQVRDTIKPVLSLVGDTIKMQYGTTLVDPGATATDNFDLNVKISVYDSTNLSVLGISKLVYIGTDSSGNVSLPLYRYVLVYDSIAPMAELIGLDTVIVDVNTTYLEEGVFATDNYYSSASLTLSTAGSIDMTVLGYYTLTYTITDGSGNSTDITRVVHVVDRIAPVILVHDPIIVKRLDPKPNLSDSVELTDNYYSATSLKPGLVVTESIDMAIPDIYTVTYQVTDSSGNTSLATKGVVIVAAGTGISSVLTNAISVYPNPSENGRFVLTSKEKNIEITAEQLSIYNSTGQSVQAEITVTGQDYVVDLGNAASGTYYLRVEMQEEAAIFKLIRR